MQLMEFDIFSGKNESLHFQNIELFKKAQLNITYNKVKNWYRNKYVGLRHIVMHIILFYNRHFNSRIA